MDRGAWRAAYSQWGHKESDMTTEWLTLSLFTFPCHPQPLTAAKPLSTEGQAQFLDGSPASHGHALVVAQNSLPCLVLRYTKSQDFLFLGSKITVDGDCSHEIRRQLLLGRKAMTHLDSVLKGRDITLPTKICIVKAIVFPVVTYGCSSWMEEKAECQELMPSNCGAGEDS